ncbi:Hypothetical_protein [Hexamita inflata]|uniref:Hypothetical_protein n=1 Tax=Hexamita inflata TaxID=28002 RepID=A0AA86P6Z7_9EUKA|nr:Hypothetical protein HINF_LOCUS20967 [Hexamita inflata]
MAKGMPSTSLQDWKAATAPLLPQKRRWYDAGGFPYRSACTKQPRYAPGCLYSSRWLWLTTNTMQGVSKNMVSIELTIIRVEFPVLSQYKRKLSKWNIQKLKLISQRCQSTVKQKQPKMQTKEDVFKFGLAKCAQQMNVL